MPTPSSSARLTPETNPRIPQVAVDRLDAGLWLLACALVLWSVPIGFVSNDGLGHSRQFAAGTWALNPNHLLFEPLGAAWQSALARLAPARDGVDALKLLSALAGAAAVALFRFRVAPLVTARRWIANLATAWVGLSSAFLRLWVSDEIHMIQMPFVVILAGGALRLFARPTLAGGVRAGIVAGVATLCFISNALLGASVALALLGSRGEGRRREAFRAAAGLAGAGLLLAVPVLFAAAGSAGGKAGWLAWLSHGRLGADRALARGESAYGLEPSAAGLGEGLLRAGYGAASAVVDLSPLAAALRDRQAPAPWAVLAGLAFLAAGTGAVFSLRVCLRASAGSPERRAGRLLLAWSAPVLLFGFLWNNSDDQFYFQLAPIFGVLAAIGAGGAVREGDPAPAARPTLPRIWSGIGVAVLAFNLADVGARRILYPRQERIAQLSAATAGACLVVTPGFDEAELIFELSPAAATVRHRSIAELATRWPPEVGIPRLLSRVAACTRQGGRVVLVDLFDTPLQRNPWKYLGRLGYGHAEVLRRLEPLARSAVAQRVGPFRLRILE
jgi:hypothetical protein